MVLSYRVYFDSQTGRIRGHDTGVNGADLGDGERLDHPPMFEDIPFVVSGVADIDPKLHIVDLDTLQVRDATPEELAMLRAPTLIEVRLLRLQELDASDKYTASDFPLTDTRRGAWVAYRQALRDITKAGEVAAMLAAWPLRPDGSDAIAHLRPMMA